MTSSINGERVKRIDVAKAVVDDFISRRPDDRMGLVAFAGRPRDASPITLDHKWLRNALGEVRLNDQFDRGTVKEQGTAIGSALAAAASRLDARDAKSKIIVLITDGASNSGKISPDRGRGTRQNPRHQDLHHRHRHQGRPRGPQHHALSLSGIRPPHAARKSPTLTGAEHYWAQNLESLKQTFTTIDQLEKTDAKSYTVIDDTELFPWFLGAHAARRARRRHPARPQPTTIALIR